MPHGASEVALVLGEQSGDVAEPLEPIAYRGGVEALAVTPKLRKARNVSPIGRPMTFV